MRINEGEHVRLWHKPEVDRVAADFRFAPDRLHNKESNDRPVNLTMPPLCCGGVRRKARGFMAHQIAPGLKKSIHIGCL